MARQPRFFVPGEVLHVLQRGNNREPISPHELYERLGHSGPERQRAYRQLFRAQLSGVDIEAIREATNKNWALGNERFKQRIEALSGRRSDLMQKGRPAKIGRPESRV